MDAVGEHICTNVAHPAVVMVLILRLEHVFQFVSFRLLCVGGGCGGGC